MLRANFQTVAIDRAVSRHGRTGGASWPRRGILRQPPLRSSSCATFSRGCTAQQAPDGFVYIDEHGAPVEDPIVLDRIRRLAIPPAWSAVWIAPGADAHLQATGFDSGGRKQYRYHRARVARRL